MALLRYHSLRTIQQADPPSTLSQVVCSTVFGILLRVNTFSTGRWCLEDCLALLRDLTGELEVYCVRRTQLGTPPFWATTFAQGQIASEIEAGLFPNSQCVMRRSQLSFALIDECFEAMR